jgi:hypothetical protein
MKTIVSCLVFLIIIQVTSIAQLASKKVKEIGINFSGSNCGIRYKTGNQSNLLRMTLLAIAGNSTWQNNPSGNSKVNSQGVGFNIGMEKRKNIKENISFYYGIDLLTSYNRDRLKYDGSSSNKFTNWSVSPGLGFVIGFNYSPNPKIIVSAEVIPSITYTYSRNTYVDPYVIPKYSTSELNYGLKNNGINLTLAYVLGK